MKAKSSYCAAHKKRKPCEPCSRSAVKHRALWQTEARRQQHHESTRHNEMAWQPDELDILRKHAGSMSSYQIAALINEWRAQYGLAPRTNHACRKAAGRYGTGIMLRDIRSQYELARALSVATETVTAWCNLGLLKRGTWGTFVVFDDAEVERFLRDYPWTVDHDGILDTRLRQIHLLVTQRDPWVNTIQLAKLAGVSPRTVRTYIQSGLIDARVRPGGRGRYMVRVSEASVVAEAYERMAQATLKRLESYRLARCAA